MASGYEENNDGSSLQDTEGICQKTSILISNKKSKTLKILIENQKHSPRIHSDRRGRRGTPTTVESALAFLKLLSTVLFSSKFKLKSL
jgi:hypothetical protein